MERPGFSPETIDFLWGIRMNNNRDWFLSHKEDYLSRLYRPMLALAEELRTLLPLLEEADRELEAARELADAANGRLAGRKKIAFEAYVQAAYFDEILRAANLRLRRMTGGRYELVRNDFQTALNDRGLELGVVDHYTGKPRSAKTLSGDHSTLRIVTECGRRLHQRQQLLLYRQPKIRVTRQFAATVSRVDGINQEINGRRKVSTMRK